MNFLFSCRLLVKHDEGGMHNRFVAIKDNRVLVWRTSSCDKASVKKGYLQPGSSPSKFHRYLLPSAGRHRT